MQKIEVLLKQVRQHRIRPALKLYGDNPDLNKISAQIDNHFSFVITASQRVAPYIFIKDLSLLPRRKVP